MEKESLHIMTFSVPIRLMVRMTDSILRTGCELRRSTAPHTGDFGFVFREAMRRRAPDLLGRSKVRNARVRGQFPSPNTWHRAILSLDFPRVTADHLFRRDVSNIMYFLHRNYRRLLLSRIATTDIIVREPRLLR